MSVKRKRLKADAVPSVFDFPEHLMPKCKSRKPPVARLTSETPACLPEASTIVRPVSDHSYAVSPTKKIKRLTSMVSKKTNR